MSLRYGYMVSGMISGIVLLFLFIGTLPDGKLKAVFCSVGQGDAIYIQFPDGKDMVVDGGPNNKIIECLSRHMPFWDRHIDIVVLTHPQKDHMFGLHAIIQRYSIGSILRSDISHTSEGYAQFVQAIEKMAIPVRYLSKGDTLEVGDVVIRIAWPSDELIATGNKASEISANFANVLGAQQIELNDFSLVQHVQYGSFDLLLTGDADARVDREYAGSFSFAGDLDVLKVPHHGSKSGMTDAFRTWASPRVSIVSVGKNSYGHPSKVVLDALNDIGSKVYRTDISGDIVVESDGHTYDIKTERSF